MASQNNPNLLTDAVSRMSPRPVGRSPDACGVSWIRVIRIEFVAFCTFQSKENKYFLKMKEFQFYEIRYILLLNSKRIMTYYNIEFGFIVSRMHGVISFFGMSGLSNVHIKGI